MKSGPDTKGHLVLTELSNNVLLSLARSANPLPASNKIDSLTMPERKGAFHFGCSNGASAGPSKASVSPAILIRVVTDLRDMSRAPASGLCRPRKQVEVARKSLSFLPSLDRSRLRIGHEVSSTAAGAHRRRRTLARIPPAVRRQPRCDAAKGAAFGELRQVHTDRRSRMVRVEAREEWQLGWRTAACSSVCGRVSFDRVSSFAAGRFSNPITGRHEPADVLNVPGAAAAHASQMP